ncbi:hypothetical protein ASPTUDRAFT_208003 [Aspergillus tubingensis CBS 134.48]|uniref:Uncharacterized protein n=1 Tax=Aspergillus tubingensis (strain CBS 134.48) TaxID=767770 RepID=A0A1L9NL88_ASPTC|nr:hypothetical protein ASPTUDRAFT_208003 [Aspergillus tubingensis CBS 134.48]
MKRKRDWRRTRSPHLSFADFIRSPPKRSQSDSLQVMIIVSPHSNSTRSAPNEMQGNCTLARTQIKTRADRFPISLGRWRNFKEGRKISFFAKPLLSSSGLEIRLVINSEGLNNFVWLLWMLLPRHVPLITRYDMIRKSSL